MLDCKMNANMAHYTESDLTKVVYDYNNCKMPGSARKNLAPAGRLNFQLFTGYQLYDILENQYWQYAVLGLVAKRLFLDFRLSCHLPSNEKIYRFNW